MDKEGAPIDKIVEDAPLVPQKEENEKDKSLGVEESTQFISKEVECAKKKALKVDFKEQKEEIPLLPKGSKQENQEESEGPNAEQENEPVETSTASGPCGTSGQMQLVYGAISFLCLILGLVLVKETANSEEYVQVVNHAVLASTFLLLCIFFLFVSCYYGQSGFNPAMLWGAASKIDGQSLRFKDCQTGTEDEDIENKRICSTGSEYSEATNDLPEGSNQPTSASVQEGASSSAALREKQPILQPTTSKDCCSVSKVSAVASAISKITSETAAKVGQSESAPAKSTDLKEQDVAENLPKDSEQEGLSSGELRRRKFKTQDGNKDLTNSSDEEAKKE